MEQPFHNDANPMYKEQENNDSTIPSGAPMGRIGALQSGMQPSGDRIDWGISDRLSDSSDRISDSYDRMSNPSDKMADSSARISTKPIYPSGPPNPGGRVAEQTFQNSDMHQHTPFAKCGSCGKNKPTLSNELSDSSYNAIDESSPNSTTVIILSIFGTFFLLFMLWLLFKLFLSEPSSTDVSVLGSPIPFNVIALSPGGLSSK